MNIPTAYAVTSPNAPYYSGLNPGTYGQQATAIGTAIGSTLGAAYETYALATAKHVKPTGYITGAYGILGTVFAATPIIGPMLMAYNLAVGGATYWNDHAKAKRKKDQIKRQIRQATNNYDAAIARGHPPEIASYIAVRDIGQRAAANIGLIEALKTNPYNPAGAIWPEGLTRQQRHDLGPWVRDPATGKAMPEAQFLELYGPAADRRAQEAFLELVRRPMPGAGQVPAPFARYHG